MARCEHCDGHGYFSEIHFVECDGYQSSGPMACDKFGKRFRFPKCSKCSASLTLLPDGTSLSALRHQRHAYIDDSDIVPCEHCSGTGQKKSFFGR